MALGRNEAIDERSHTAVIIAREHAAGCGDAQAGELCGVAAGTRIRLPSSGQNQVIRLASARAHRGQGCAYVVKHAEGVCCDQYPDRGVQPARELEVREPRVEGREDAARRFNDRPKCTMWRYIRGKFRLGSVDPTGREADVELDTCRARCKVWRDRIAQRVKRVG